MINVNVGRLAFLQAIEEESVAANPKERRHGSVYIGFDQLSKRA
jgi:hypothetical protein